jgi:hypothetical protein
MCCFGSQDDPIETRFSLMYGSEFWAYNEDGSTRSLTVTSYVYWGDTCAVAKRVRRPSILCCNI